MMRKAWLAAVCESALFGGIAGVAQSADGIKTQQGRPSTAPFKVARP
ncbi:MAG: hypothetical protein ACRDCY_23545 [Aeromonas veronii]